MISLLSSFLPNLSFLCNSPHTQCRGSLCSLPFLHTALNRSCTEQELVQLHFICQHYVSLYMASPRHDVRISFHSSTVLLWLDRFRAIFSPNFFNFVDSLALLCWLWLVISAQVCSKSFFNLVLKSPSVANFTNQTFWKCQPSPSFL